MRATSIFLLILALPVIAFPQDKPITQTEYVRMLYTLEKDPGSRTIVVDALRRRGIAFVLTDGVRGLTRSKGRNNDELKRALEEAERRRRDPEGSKLPGTVETTGFIEKARTRALETVEEMPDFVVKQLISRFIAYAGTGNWKSIDNLVVAVSYHSEKGEQYRVLAKNGAPVPEASTAGSYYGVGGATSTGQFVEDLAKIFRLESKTRFELLTTDVVRTRRTLVYDYVINIENNKGRGIIYADRSNEQSSPAGEKGRIWIDRETFRVLRIEKEATDITPKFPIRAVNITIDFDTVDIAGEKHLLPIISELRFNVQEGLEKPYDTRNIIRFRNYQKYGTDVIAVEEDSEPAPEEKP